MSTPTVTESERLAEQARKARQLLLSSANHSYDPYLDIDWTAPLVEGKWFLPERFCSLYGTELWDSLSTAQQLACSREELASSIALGVWTEHMLLQMVSRYVYDRDVSSPQVRFALTEVADECRHMIMFSHVISAIGAEVYPTPKAVLRSGRLLKTFAPVPVLWALILLTEEIFERIQRAMASDDTVQPVVRAMSRIHVVEEARHIGFARTELANVVPKLSTPARFGIRAVLAMSVRTFSVELFNPTMYRRAGLDPVLARTQAMHNPSNKKLFAWAAERITGHYRSIGLIGGSTEPIWRRAGFLAENTR